VVERTSPVTTDAVVIRAMTISIDHLAISSYFFIDLLYFLCYVAPGVVFCH